MVVNNVLFFSAQSDQEAVFLIIDEDSIGSGNAPNFFSDTAVNDHFADIGVRSQLLFFAGNETGESEGGDRANTVCGEIVGAEPQGTIVKLVVEQVRLAVAQFLISTASPVEMFRATNHLVLG